MREAALMNSLRHPNIVSLIGVCTAGEPRLILLQFCEHGSLAA
jgi:serine/threonine protein kinase